MRVLASRTFDVLITHGFKTRNGNPRDTIGFSLYFVILANVISSHVVTTGAPRLRRSFEWN